MTPVVGTSVRSAIVGTQTLAHKEDSRLSWLRIELALAKLQPDVVISGGAHGVDEIAEQVAIKSGYSEIAGFLSIYRPERKTRNGPGGFKERNSRIVDDCTHLLRVACASATTYGSGWTADRAEKLGRPVVRWSPCR